MYQFITGKTDDTLDFLTSHCWVDKKQDFFEALAEFLSYTLEADYICIDRLHSNLEAETVAVYYDGHFRDNVRYTLKDTPCGEVNGNQVCFFPSDVKQMFPKDVFLQEIEAESYAGITLWNTRGKPMGLIAAISRKPIDMLVAESVLKIVSIRAAAELEYRQTEKMFHALGKSSNAMLNASDEKVLMNQVCDIIVKDCGYALMWIGMISKEAGKRIIPVANAGFEAGYLEKIVVTWDDTDSGRGPTGTAVRTGKPCVCHNMHTDPDFKPWRESAIKRGYASSVAIPLKAEGKTLGALTIYAREPEYFDESEVKFLVEMANNLTQGIAASRLREERQKAIYELQDGMTNLEFEVDMRTFALKEAIQQLKSEINSRQKSEIALQKAEEKYRTVADFTHDCESWLGPDGHFIYISPSFEQTTGYTAEEFMNDSSLYYKIAHPDDKATVFSHFNDKLNPNHEPCQLEYRIITRDGQEKWMGHTCHPVFNKSGDWLGRRGSNRDITSQKKAERVMLDSQKQLRALTQRLDDMVDEQSKRIAREIHDELGHQLTALKFEIENLSENPDSAIGSMHDEINTINNLVESLINSIRKIATELRPDILDHLGLIPSLQWQVKQFSKRTKICYEITMDEISYSFESKQTNVIFRILQEILTNVARHSGAKNVSVHVIQNDRFFVMKVTDNGCGFSAIKELSDSSLGMVGMHERALSIGGEMIIESTPGTGTAVTFKLPLKETT